jgi:hypothetical protein
MGDRSWQIRKGVRMPDTISISSTLHLDDQSYEVRWGSTHRPPSLERQFVNALGNAGHFGLVKRRYSSDETVFTIPVISTSQSPQSYAEIIDELAATHLAPLPVEQVAT